MKPGWDFQPGLKFRKTSCNRIKISARAEVSLGMLSDCVFNETRSRTLTVSPQFQISARAETSHVIATKFQPRGRAEIRHVIGPSVL